MNLFLDISWQGEWEGVSEFKHRWVMLPRPWPSIVVIIVNEAFCIIDYLIPKDISVILCYRALALAQKQKISSEEYVWSSGWWLGTVNTEDLLGLCVQHWLIIGSWHQAMDNRVKTIRFSWIPRKFYAQGCLLTDTLFLRAEDNSWTDDPPRQVTPQRLAKWTVR